MQRGGSDGMEWNGSVDGLMRRANEKLCSAQLSWSLIVAVIRWSDSMTYSSTLSLGPRRSHDRPLHRPGRLMDASRWRLSAVSDRMRRSALYSHHPMTHKQGLSISFLTGPSTAACLKPTTRKQIVRTHTARAEIR